MGERMPHSGLWDVWELGSRSVGLCLNMGFRGSLTGCGGARVRVYRAVSIWVLLRSEWGLCVHQSVHQCFTMGCGAWPRDSGAQVPCLMQEDVDAPFPPADYLQLIDSWRQEAGLRMGALLAWPWISSGIGTVRHPAGAAKCGPSASSPCRGGEGTG